MLWTRTGRLNPLGCTSPTVSETAHVLGGRQHAVGDQHLPGPGIGAQAGGEIRDAADGGVVEASFEPDPAEGREALGDTDSQRQVMPVAEPASPRVRARRHGCPRPSGPRAPRRRHTESGSLKNTIIPSPVNRSRVPSYWWTKRSDDPVVLAEHAHHLFGLTCLRERGEVPQIGEDDDDLAPMALQQGLVADDQLRPVAVTGSGAAG